MLDLEVDYFAERPKERQKKAVEVKPISEDKTPPSEIIVDTKAVDTSRLYRLMYPDSIASRPYSGKYKVTVDNVEKELEIIEGVIQTRNPMIKDILMMKGFIFMYETQE